MDLNPSVVLDTSTSFRLRAQTGSIGVKFLETGFGWGKLSGRTGFMEWGLNVGGLSLSAIPLQASYHGTTEWTLSTPRISLAEAFISFTGCIGYGLLCSSVPLKHNPGFPTLLHALDKLRRVFPDVRQTINWLRSKGNLNSVEVRIEAAQCGGRLAYKKASRRAAFSWSTPQAAIGVTQIQFAGLDPLRAALAIGSILNGGGGGTLPSRSKPSDGTVTNPVRDPRHPRTGQTHTRPGGRVLRE